MVPFSGTSPSTSLYLIKKKLHQIAQIHGRGTELLTLYLPPGMQISDVQAKLRSEEGAASNIKSNVTRVRVLEAIARSQSILKLYRTIPEKGICIFLGRVGDEKSTDLIEHVFEPPVPVRSFIYQFSENFLVDPILSELSNAKRIGILAIDSSEIGIGMLRGDHVEALKVLTSGIGGKTRKGGQSSRRYERNRNAEIIIFFNRAANTINRIFLAEHPIDGLIVGGPGFSKSEFLERDVLDYRLKKMVLGVIDGGYSGREGIRDIAMRSQGLLKESRFNEEKDMVQRFLKEIAYETGRAVYGAERVKAALSNGSVEVVLAVEGDGKIEEFDELAALSGSKLEVISRTSEAGRQLEGFGIVALLKN